MRNQFQSQEVRNKFMNKSVFVLGGVGVFFLFLLATCSVAVVPPGHRGVKVVLGSPSQTVLEEGVHLVSPVGTSVKKISIRIQKTESQADAATKDLQRVHATVALNWHLSPASVVGIYQNIGDLDDVATRIIDPAVSETLKAATAQLTAEEVLVKRLFLKETIDSILIKRLTQYNIVVNDISLVNLNFTNDFNEAVERKQVAEQEAKKAVYESQRAQEQAKAKVNLAIGEAEAQRLQKSTLSKNMLMLEFLKRWDGKLPSVISGQGSNLLMQLQNLKDSE